jgi:hypothetical protein
LLESEGFLCQCELCALPDHISDTLDVKLKVIDEAAWFIVDRKECKDEEDSLRALQHLEDVTSSLSEPRIASYIDFILPLHLLAYLGREDRFLKVLEAMIPAYERCLGNRGLGDGAVFVEVLYRFRANPRCNPYWRNWDPAGTYSTKKRINRRIQTATSDFISLLQKYP